jgi:ribosomal protein S18 acetylase RimI-like enzyme
MILEQTVTWLEMTSPDELRPGRLPPEPLELVAAGPALAPLLAETTTRVGRPHGWTSRPAWSAAQWAEHLARPGVRARLARVGGEPAGVIELETRPGDEVEITIFGLVPEVVGRGFCGHLLTQAVRLAWAAEQPDGAPTRRVWLHTASADHANALPNYRARGFRVVRSEVRRKEVPDEDARRWQVGGRGSVPDSDA